MSFVIAGSVGAIVVAILASRAVSMGRVSNAKRSEDDRQRNADGVFTGAEPIDLEGSSDCCALVLHGFNDTPQSLSHLGRALNARGWTVVIPLLPQHGRGGDVFIDSGNADDWISAAREAWSKVRGRGSHCVIIGQSMGGAIATILAVEHPPSALVLLAPYLSMNRAGRWLARIWPLWQLAVPQLRSNPERALRDPAARARSLGGTRFSPRLVAELLGIVRRARRALDQVTVPALVIHARSDYRIPSVSAQDAYERLGSRDKTLLWSAGGHVVAADEGRETVINSILEWLDKRVAHEGAGAGTTFDSMRKA